MHPKMNTVSSIIMHDIRVPLRKSSYDYDAEACDLAKKAFGKLQSSAPRRLGIIDKAETFAVSKKSVDARREQGTIDFVYSVAALLDEPVLCDDWQFSALRKFCARFNASPVVRTVSPFLSPVEMPALAGAADGLRPVVAGFGPCGMFAALTLARAGARPIVLERGSRVEQRAEKVRAYWETGMLDCETNVQFGEGGAGTFSDGKLLTRVNDGLCRDVLETFCRYGADEAILTAAKPHVGTDKLQQIVKNIREAVLSLGGEIHFDTKLTGLMFRADGRIRAVETTEGAFETDALFLAVGHSARDTFTMLHHAGVPIAPKPFSVGVRIEHRQETISRAMYGADYDNPALPPAEYTLSRRYGDRAVYSFCMCPGGYVVASASEAETIVTNGMSKSTRDGENANAAIAVSVPASDFGNDAFAAIAYQRNIERAAFALAGKSGAAPIENVGHFLGKAPLAVTDVLPTYTGKTSLCCLDALFPDAVTSLLRTGIAAFDRYLTGFSDDGAILTAPETRTSSPVRIPRGQNREAEGFPGIYPCGEGAGYAGGITSAAVDGIRSALAYLETRRNMILNQAAVIKTDEIKTFERNGEQRDGSACKSPRA